MSGPLHNTGSQGLSSTRTNSLFNPSTTTSSNQSSSLSAAKSSLFSPVDTSANNALLNSTSRSLFSNTHPSTTAHTSSLQPSTSLFARRDTSSSFGLPSTTTATTASAAITRSPSSFPKGTCLSKPPSFFKIDDDTMDLDDSDYYLYPKEEKASAAFGEGRTILSLGKADSKIVPYKRASTASLFGERRGTEDKGRPDKGKARDIGTSSTEDKEKEAGSSTTPEQQQKSTSTVYVFGFAPNSERVILEHFAKYGEIIEHKRSPGNWLTIQYASDESAEKALQSNGVAVTGDYIIGVSLVKAKKPQPPSPTTETAPKKLRTIDVVPASQAKDLFKKPETKAPTTGNIGLGSGKAGLSALSCPNVSPAGDIRLIKEPGLLNKVKDLLFEW